MGGRRATSYWVSCCTVAALLRSAGTAFAPSPLVSCRRPSSSNLSLATTRSAVETSCSFSSFQGHDVYAQVMSPPAANSNKKPVVLLIHGFGCSTAYWRATQSALVAAGYTVHAIDLLGQGQSAKPLAGVEYSIRLWAQQCDDYVRDNIPNENNVVLLGNSLGSLVALTAATGDFVSVITDQQQQQYRCTIPQRIRGIGMFNCGVGLNFRGIANEPQWNPVQRYLIRAAYAVLDTVLFKNKLVLSYVLDQLVTTELLTETLRSLYKSSPERVDEALVESFLKPAKDVGSVEALSQIYTNDPGATPMELHDQYQDALKELPIHLVWGDDDAVTPVTGGVGQFYSDLARNEQAAVTLDVIEQCGHIPFDDHCDESNQSMLDWLERIC